MHPYVHVNVHGSGNACSVMNSQCTLFNSLFSLSGEGEDAVCSHQGHNQEGILLRGHH